MKILVIEDHPTLNKQLVRSLREQSYAVDFSFDGEEGLYKIQNWPFDLVILDIMLENMDGLEILEQVRRVNQVPVILLTARDGLNDRVSGLDLGADDYLTKPFEMSELLARVRSLLRRSKNKTDPKFTIGDVIIDSNTRKVSIDGGEILLTSMEYAITMYLAMSRGKIVSTTELLDAILDENDDTMSNSLNVHIFNIRKKLGRDFIKTVRGRGYLIE